MLQQDLRFACRPEFDSTPRAHSVWRLVRKEAKAMDWARNVDLWPDQTVEADLAKPSRQCAVIVAAYR